MFFICHRSDETDKRRCVILSNTSLTFAFLQVWILLRKQLNNIFVLGAGGGAGRYFKVRTESEAVLGDSEWFE